MSNSIALVDDDATILDALGMALEFQGWRVHGYARGDALLSELERERVDCVILDPNLGYGISGVEVAKKVLEHGIPIIGLTARPDSASTCAIVAIGVRLMLTKPVTAEELIGHINDLLGESATGQVG